MKFEKTIKRVKERKAGSHDYHHVLTTHALL